MNLNHIEMQNIIASTRCVFIGDPGVGKTSVVETYLTGTFPQTFTQAAFGSQGKIVMLDGIRMYLSIGDYPGDDSFDHLRYLIYQSTDIVILCFSVDNQESIDNLKTKWWPEVKKYCPKAQIILLETKSDLKRTSRDITDSPPLIENSQAIELMNEISAVRYIECSALLNKGLKELFEKTIPHAFHDKPKLEQNKGLSRRHSCLLQ